jgi:hypothetical protein
MGTVILNKGDKKRWKLNNRTDVSVKQRTLDHVTTFFSNCVSSSSWGSVCCVLAIKTVFDNVPLPVKICVIRC